VISEPKSFAVEPELLWGWLAARSIARGLPLPVPEHGGMRVDTGMPNELRRYVFAGPGPGLQELASLTHPPRTFIKMCGASDQLLRLIPAKWQLQPSGYLMTHAGARDALQAPAPGYQIEVEQQGLVISARGYAQDGSIAASGYAAEHGGIFVFDRIATHAAHRRRGLGRAIMSALGSMQRANTAQRVLVATEEGRALYSTLGWKVRSAYSTIAIPDDGDCGC
jgi:GNAT superfamily N-acetyltransferase